MTNVKLGFDAQLISVRIEHILPTVQNPKNLEASAKFQTIVSSVRELGVIEPLAVYRMPGDGSDYGLLDGHMRLEALRLLDQREAPCMVSTDDEGFTFNRHVNRLTAVQEHRMIRATLEKGTSPERLAKVLKVDIARIRQKLHLLDNIAPEVASMLKDRTVSPEIFGILKKMKPMRQIEAAEMMTAANRLTVNYAEMLLVTTRPESLALPGKAKQREGIDQQDILRMEREMERLHQDYQAVEDTMGETLLSLVVAKGYMARLLRNETVLSHLKRHHSELLESVVVTMDAIATESRALERD
jgi:ParB-like chromosome segregation protein Spo0J